MVQAEADIDEQNSDLDLPNSFPFMLEDDEMLENDFSDEMEYSDYEDDIEIVIADTVVPTEINTEPNFFMGTPIFLRRNCSTWKNRTQDMDFDNTYSTDADYEEESGAAMVSYFRNPELLVSMLYKPNSVQRARITHDRVTLHKLTKFQKWHNLWLRANVNQESETSLQRFLVGNNEEPTPGVSAVINVHNSSSAPPYRPYNTYHVLPK